MDYEVGDTIYEFPDSMSEQEVVTILQQQGIIPGVPATPAAPPADPLPAIPPAADLAAAREQAAQQAAFGELELRQDFIPEGERAGESARVLDRERRAQDLAARQVLQPGRDEPRQIDPTGLPQFRPSRIIEEEIPAVLPSGEFLTERRIAGQLGAPTAREEVTESLAQQTVLGADSARAIGERIAAEQAEIDRRVAADEEVSAFEFAGPALSGILTQVGETAGVVETELGAALRSTLGWVSALAAEGYFRGLGYEVDASGVPVDPDDLGLAIAQARRSIGIPDVVYPLQAVTAIPRAAVSALDEDAGRTLENLVKSVPQLAVPTPGVATTSQTRKLTTFDPEGRKTVAVVEVPSPLKDFRGFVDAEVSRIAQNVASGRTMGDEFVDAPAVRDWYAEVWGDPDAAYYAGSLSELAIPAGPGTAAKGAKGLAKLAKVDQAAAQAGRAAIRAAQHLEKGTFKGPRFTLEGRIIKAAQAAALGVANPVADIAAAVTTGRAADGRVARKVATNVLKSGALDEATAARAIQAIKPSSDTPAQIVRDVAPILGENTAYFGRQLVLNVPDDVVMVTSNVGIPRVHLPAMQRSLSRFRRQVFGGSPQDVVDRLPDAIGEQLRAFDSWADVPTTLRREATTLLEDAHAISEAPKQARLARDLTAAQVYLEGQTQGIELLTKSRALQTPTARRAKAILGGGRLLEQETAAVAQARQAIRSAAQTELRRIGQRMSVKSRELGNADAAVDGIFVEELAKAPKPLDNRQAWEKVMGAIYGDEQRGFALLDRAIERGLVPTTGVNPMFMPTVDALRAVDQALMKANTPGMFGARGTSRLTAHFAPDYQKALLKVAVDEGTKKALAAQGRYTEQLGSAVEALTKRAGERRTGSERLVSALSKPEPREVPRLRSGDIERQRVYDIRQSHAEMVLAENGEEFAEFIEGIAPRARGSLQSVLGELAQLALGTGRRNIATNASYGYVLPNVVGFPYALFRQMLTPLLTVGLKESTDITNQLLKRRIYGGGLTTNDGVFYTGKQLQELGEQLGLGYSTVESERVGSIANDLLRDARRAAEGPLEGVVKRELNPLDKSFYTRTAEALEHSMRQAAFEAQLLKGSTPEAAAAYARRALFDYSEVPGAIRNTIGTFVATAAGNTKLYTELARAIMTNPDKARILFKAQLQKARAQDPYNLHGDKALKSLGIITAGDGVYYGPEVPIFAPVEAALGMARQGDLLVRDLERSIQAAQQAGSTVHQVVQGNETITRALNDVALPAVYRALEAAKARALGTDYSTQGIEGAAPVSDEQMFWSAALYAHHSDMGRELGLWDWFERVFKPKDLPPPDNAKHPTLPRYWTRVPAGKPHILWGRDERGLPLYKVFEPSDEGLTALKTMRALTPEAIEKALVGGTAGLELKPGVEPERIYGGDLRPTTAGQAVAGALLERGPADPERERRRQVQQIAGILGGSE